LIGLQNSSRNYDDGSLLSDTSINNTHMNETIAVTRTATVQIPKRSGLARRSSTILKKRTNKIDYNDNNDDDDDE
jgi:hypothetical protein